MSEMRLLLGHEFIAPPRGPISGDTCAKLVMRDGVAGVCAQSRSAHYAKPESEINSHPLYYPHSSPLLKSDGAAKQPTPSEDVRALVERAAAYINLCIGAAETYSEEFGVIRDLLAEVARLTRENADSDMEINRLRRERDDLDAAESRGWRRGIEEAAKACEERSVVWEQQSLEEMRSNQDLTLHAWSLSAEWLCAAIRSRITAAESGEGKK